MLSSPQKYDVTERSLQIEQQGGASIVSVLCARDVLLITCLKKQSLQKQLRSGRQLHESTATFSLHVLQLIADIDYKDG